jgi:hypothetical protein
MLVAAGDEGVGTNCPTGGRKLDVGFDKNKNGTLDANEILSTDYVCNGPAGHNGLVAVTDLEVGDAHCRSGGKQIDTGVDANDDGTLAGDEIAKSQYVCNGADITEAKPIAPPDGPAAAYAINAQGGTGTTSGGGAGGYFQAIMSDGTGGGHLKLFTTGQADATFAFPAIAALPDVATLAASAQLGKKALVVNANMTIKTYIATVHGTTPGEFHTHANDPHIYVANGTNTGEDAATPIATGLSVAPGMTLTIEANYAGPARAQIVFADSATEPGTAGDVVNNGTIVAATATDSANGVTINSVNYYGNPNSSILAKGKIPTTATTVGGAGAAINVTCSHGFFNQGSFDTSGADGNNAGGGAAGTQVVDVGSATATNTFVHNAGTLTARGGAGTAGVGGAGGSVQLFGFHGVVNSGAIDTSGGSGAGVGNNGGIAQLIELSAPDGHVHNTGLLTAKGGGGAAAGGDGSYVSLNAGAGDLRNTAAIDTTGGKGNTGFGGLAGYLYLYGDRGVFNSATLTAKGGDSTAASAGAGFHVELVADYGPVNNSGAITTSGGNGKVAGGNSSYICLGVQDNGDIRNAGPLTADGGTGDTGVGGAHNGASYACGNTSAQPYNYGTHLYVAYSINLYSVGGGIVNSASLSAKGGASNAGMGGAGGNLWVASEYGDSLENLSYPGDTVISGNLESAGGAGNVDGGSGGSILINLNGYAAPFQEEIQLLGYQSLDVSGGNATLTALGDGGDAGGVILYQSYGEDYLDPALPPGSNTAVPGGAIINNVPIFAHGGAGSNNGSGGAGGFLDWETNDTQYLNYVGYQKIYNYAALDLHGGMGGATGGSGGAMYWFGLDGVLNLGAINGQGGEGNSSGGRGGYYGGSTSEIHGDDLLDLKGAMNFSGGNTKLAGGAAGAGGDLTITSRTGVDVSAPIDVSGGDDAEGSSGNGGDGGDVMLLGSLDGAKAASIDARGGTGDTVGTDGWILLQGERVQGKTP